MMVFQFHAHEQPTLSERAVAAGVVCVHTPYRTVRFGLIEQWTIYAPSLGVAYMTPDGGVDVHTTPLQARRISPELGRCTVACWEGVYALPVRWRGQFAAQLTTGQLVKEVDGVWQLA